MKIRSPIDNSIVEVPDGTTKTGALEHLVNSGKMTQDQAINFAKEKGIQYTPKYIEKTPGHLYGAPMMAIEGLTLGHAGELGAGIQSIAQEMKEFVGEEQKPIKDRYSENLENIKHKLGSYKSAEPEAAFASEYGTMLIPTTASLTLAKGGSKLSKSAGIGRQMAAGGGLGITGYHGSLDSEYDKFDPTAAAGYSAVGGSFPLATRLGGVALNKLFKPGDDGINNFLQMLSQSSGKTVDELSDELSRLGDDATLMNALDSAGLSGVGELARFGNAQTTRAIQENIGKQLTGAGKRISDDLYLATTKKKFGYHDNLNSLIKTRRVNAEKNYNESLSKPVLVDDEFIEFIANEPLLRDAWNRVASKHRNIMKEIVPGTGNMSEFSLGDGKLLQEFKWEVDKMINSYSKSTNASEKTLARYAKERKTELIDEIDSKLPGFKSANEIYAGDSAMIAAQQAGIRDGLNKINIEEQLKNISELSPSEKDAYLNGVMSNLYNQLGKKSEDAIPNLKNLESENSHKVLEMLLGKGGADKIMSGIKRENTFLSHKGAAPKKIPEVQREAELMLKGAGKNQGSMSNAVGFLADLNYNRAMIYRLGQDIVGKPSISAEEAEDLARILTDPRSRYEGIMRLKQRGYDDTMISKIISASETGGASAGIAGFLTDREENAGN